MFGGSVSAKNMMGPLGIGKAGLGFAARGTDWLIWFLAMISANLAVVNFLPIPIVDGGLFLFLIIEKFQGRPLSPKVQSIAQLVGIVLDRERVYLRDVSGHHAALRTTNSTLNFQRRNAQLSRFIIES